MGNIKSYVPVVLAILISCVIMLFVGIEDVNKNPSEVYKVYIDGICWSN